MPLSEAFWMKGYKTTMNRKVRLQNGMTNLTRLNESVLLSVLTLVEATVYKTSSKIPTLPNTQNPITSHHSHFTAPFWDHLGELVPEENFWTLWCKED